MLSIILAKDQSCIILCTKPPLDFLNYMITYTMHMCIIINANEY